MQHQKKIKTNELCKSGPISRTRRIQNISRHQKSLSSPEQNYFALFAMKNPVAKKLLQTPRLMSHYYSYDPESQNLQQSQSPKTDEDDESQIEDEDEINRESFI